MGSGWLNAGWIYALRSDNSPYVKIGLTTTTPFQRIRELNASSNYGPLGPWQQLHIKQVRDVRAMETAIHRRLSELRVTEIAATRELFLVSPEQARSALDAIPEAELSAPTPINELRLQPDFIACLMRVFETSGLENFKELQEAWTFALFPSTAGGRYFTLNIDRHEVAYSAPARNDDEATLHVLVVDKMAKRDKELKKWLRNHRGGIESVPYSSSWGNAVLLVFECDFDESIGLFQLPEFRRALIAYWYAALLRMKERGTRSLHARRHNYDATSEIFRHLSESRVFRQQKF